ncbi:6-phospho-3-hexuloisomerase [Bacillus sp. FJAT-50079]|uniref:6-phospho-3-hexuloisomerase n=1 Tax=Bacillus sp. FJAT-50079 TaxID=2833577 RepID=UPI001BC9E27B|nr:6-phospho-3-hexuloisomerase [Bacillus sp. FJAT-50079]MBS4210472.1 6-phospho-3-hexuloisomerase [Bacillus sp. FJAT-50079]
MSKLMKQLEAIMKELEAGLSLMDVSESEEVLQTLKNADRIFLAGAGRSGLAIRAFANRLLHLGKTVYMVGDITTPSIGANDVLFIGSGSGETSSLVVNAEKAKQLGAKVILNTTNPQSTLGKIADCKLVIKAANKDNGSSIQPMGAAFEQLSFLVYDAIILQWITAFDVAFDSMRARHANLE